MNNKNQFSDDRITLSFSSPVATLRFTLYPYSLAIWHDVPRLCFFVYFLLECCWAALICRLIFSHRTWGILFITLSNIFSCSIFSFFFFFFWYFIYIYDKLHGTVSWLYESTETLQKFLFICLQVLWLASLHLKYAVKSCSEFFILT